MTAAHRSIDGTSLHVGFVDDCTECAPRFTPDSHSPDDHHPYVDVSMAGAGFGGLCYCGSIEDTAIHDRPYCLDCLVAEPDPLDFGAPHAWWFKLYSRLVARFGRRY